MGFLRSHHIWISREVCGEVYLHLKKMAKTTSVNGESEFGHWLQQEAIFSLLE